VYGTDFTVTLKDDRSPLTEADKRATIIDAGLRALDPSVLYGRGRA
jgi:3'-phosphoadenosine 5'-phosphosulfate (PAPS) 3'-phosphatase